MLEINICVSLDQEQVFCLVCIQLLFTHLCTHYDLLYAARLFVTAVVLVTEAGVSVSALLAVAISVADLIEAAVSAAVADAMEDCSRYLGRKTLVAAAVSAAETLSTV